MLIRGGDDCFVTPRVLIEFWVIATRPVQDNGLGWTGRQTLTVLERFLDQFRLLQDTPAVFSAWMARTSTRPALGKKAHDLRLVAVIDAHSIDHILTFDARDFMPMDSKVPIHPRHMA